MDCCTKALLKGVLAQVCVEIDVTKLLVPLVSRGSLTILIGKSFCMRTLKCLLSCRILGHGFGDCSVLANND